MSGFSYTMVYCQVSGLQIAVPDPEEVEQKYRENSSLSFPFWTRLWPSAIALAAFISDHSELFKDKRVVEFGAGIGLPSLVAARSARSVIITDHDAESVRWAERNIESLGLDHVKAREANWSDFANEMADIILLSDVSYDPASFDVLQELIRHFISAGSTIILAMPERIISGHFLDKIREQVAYATTIVVEEKKVIIACLGS